MFNKSTCNLWQKKGDIQDGRKWSDMKEDRAPITQYSNNASLSSFLGVLGNLLALSHHVLLSVNLNAGRRDN